MQQQLPPGAKEFTKIEDGYRLWGSGIHRKCKVHGFSGSQTIFPELKHAGWAGSSLLMRYMDPHNEKNCWQELWPKEFIIGGK
jgi:hypothetical protein